MFKKIFGIPLMVIMVAGISGASELPMKDRIFSASVNLSSGQGTLALTVSSGNFIDCLLKRDKLELKVTLDRSEWMLDQGSQYAFLNEIAQKLSGKIELLELEKNMTELNKSFEIEYRKVKAEKIDLLQRSLEKDSTLAMLGAWGYLSDYAMDKQGWRLQSAIMALLGYKKACKTDEPIAQYSTNLGRICFEFGDKLSPEQKQILGLGEVLDLKAYGLGLLKSAAEGDETARDYLNTHCNEESDGYEEADDY